MLCGYLGTLSDNVGLLRPFEGRSVVARAVLMMLWDCQGVLNDTVEFQGMSSCFR